MTGINPERPGINQLSEIVFGPAGQPTHAENEARIAQEQLAEGLAALQAACDRGDPRVIEEVEGHLGELFDTNPSLRLQFTTEE